MPDLKVCGLARVLGGRSVLSGLGLDLAGGETAAVVGPSGSGKSTLLNLLGALDTPDAGSILLGDIEVNGLAGSQAESYRAESVGFVFQEHHLLRHLTALENVLIPGLARTARHQPRHLLRELVLRFQLPGVERKAHGVFHISAMLPWDIAALAQKFL